MLNKLPLVTVLMPVYNAEKYVGEAIESILNQSFKNFEFIIINDGSTDRSLEIIEKYSKKDKRIKIISRNNKGLIFSLNEGIELSRGKYIARMDADDISILNRFELQLNVFKSKKKLAVCGGWAELIGEAKGTLTPVVSDKRIKDYLNVGSPLIHPSVMIKRSEIKETFYEKKFNGTEDYAFWVELSKQNKIFYNIPKVILKYRVLQSSITRIAEKDNIKRKIEMEKIYYKLYEDKGLSEKHYLYLNGKMSKENAKLHFKSIEKINGKSSSLRYIYYKKYGNIFQSIFNSYSKNKVMDIINYYRIIYRIIY